MAWPIFGANIFVWIIVALVSFKGMETVTKFIKYSTVVIFALLLILLIRFVCLPDALEGVVSFLTPTLKSIRQVPSWIGSPILSVAAFGTGWGTVLTMASFNKFKTNVFHHLLYINATLLVAGIFSGLLVNLADGYLKEHLHFKVLHYYYYHPFNFLFIGFPFLFGNLEASQLWSLLFYLMLSLCELNSVIVVVLTTITTLFDEYEYLRAYKREVCVVLPAALFLLSISLATNYGYEVFNTVLRLCGASQMGICFLELMMVVWIYGRERFQRDVQFMLGIPFQTWMFYLVRFLTPIFTLFVLLFYVMASIYESWSIHFSTYFLLITIKFLPWIVIPAYIVAKLISTSGSIGARFRRCTRPNDWYPVDPSERQKYEEMLGNSDLTHQLVDMAAEDNAE